MATKTIGTNSRDYATWALWAAYVNALTNISVAERGECYNDSEFTTSAKITFGGWTLSGGSVTLTCAAGQSFRDNAGVLTNALRYNQANGVGLSANIAYDQSILVSTAGFTLDGVQIKNTNTSNQGIYKNSAVSTVQNCVLQSVKTFASTDTLVEAFFVNLTFLNNLLLATGNQCRGLTLESGGTITDNTIVATGGAAGPGIRVVYSDGPVIKNTAIAGWTTDCSGTAGASSSNNATDQASFGGTNFGSSGQTSLVGTTEWVSVTNGSEDLRVKSTSVKLKGNGATAGPSDDIAKQTRTAPYTIGCWQFVAAGGGGLVSGALEGTLVGGTLVGG